MDLLDSNFQAKLVEQARRRSNLTLAKIIEEKLKEKGVVLSKSQLFRLRKKIKEGDSSEIKFRNIALPKNKISQMVDIKISKDELRLFKAENKSILKMVPKIIEEVSDLSAKSFSLAFKKAWRKSRKSHQEEHNKVASEVIKIWKKPLDSLEFLISLAIEFGDSVNGKCREKCDTESPNLIEALTRLYARICQVSSEVLTLLKNGFADGAMARWRTVHELVVVSSFIKDNGEEIAERYFFHNDVESFKAATQYQKYCKALGYKSLSKKELKNLTELYSTAISRYGHDFKGGYGWAIPALNNPRPTFANIEESVGLDHFRPLFKMASHNVHGGPKGILHRLGLLEEEFLLAGPSDIGLGDPGINTAISLPQAASNLFDLVPTLDCLIWMKSLGIIGLDTQKTFLKIEEKQNYRLGKNAE